MGFGASWGGAGISVVAGVTGRSASHVVAFPPLASQLKQVKKTTRLGAGTRMARESALGPAGRAATPSTSATTGGAGEEEEDGGREEDGGPADPLADLRSEVEVMQALAHPNLVALKEVIDDREGGRVRRAGEGALPPRLPASSLYCLAGRAVLHRHSCFRSPDTLSLCSLSTLPPSLTTLPQPPAAPLPCSC